MCDYYENQAKKLGKWQPKDLVLELTVDKLYKGIPGSSASGTSHSSSSNVRALPPPPTLQQLPQPPPKVLHEDTQKQIGRVLKFIS